MEQQSDLMNQKILLFCTGPETEINASYKLRFSYSTIPEEFLKHIEKADTAVISILFTENLFTEKFSYNVEKNRNV